MTKDPDFESTTGLKTGINEAEADFLTKLQAVADESRQRLIHILVWGPSSRGVYAAKRTEIIEHLRNLPQNNDVQTSEDLDTLLPDLVEAVPNLLDREKLHAQQADVIFVLVQSREQTGAQGELVMIYHDLEIRRKTWLMVPEHWESEGFLNAAVDGFPEERKKVYTNSQFRDCQMIRSFCEQKVKEIRAERQLMETRLRGMP